MPTSEIRYPDDTTNTGKREATRTLTEDSVTKHIPRVLVQDNRVRTGIYYLHSGAFLVQASADVAPAGRMWIFNAAPPLLSIRRIRFTSQHNSALATPTAPRIVVERITFTGTPSGTAITAAKRRASDVAPSTWSARSTNAGATITSVSPVCAFYPVSALTAVGTAVPVVDEWEPITSEDMLVLGGGEGLRIYQADAGTASDTRRYHLDIVIDEFTEF